MIPRLAGNERSCSAPRIKPSSQYNRCLRRWTTPYGGCGMDYPITHKFSFSKIPFLVRWSNCFNTNRLNSLLPFRWWPDCPSIAERSRSYAYLPPQPIFSPTCLSGVICYYPSSKSYNNTCPPPINRRSQIGDRSRAPAGVSMDGQASQVLNPGDSVTVRASLHPIPCINRSSISDPTIDTHGEGAGPGKEDDWVRDINNLLQYNATFRSKALLRHSRT